MKLEFYGVNNMLPKKNKAQKEILNYKFKNAKIDSNPYYFISFRKYTSSLNFNDELNFSRFYITKDLDYALSDVYFCFSDCLDKDSDYRFKLYSVINQNGDVNHFKKFCETKSLYENEPKHEFCY